MRHSFHGLAGAHSAANGCRPGGNHTDAVVLRYTCGVPPIYLARQPASATCGPAGRCRHSCPSGGSTRYICGRPPGGDISRGAKLEPCHGPPAAPSPSPPHCKAGNEVEPPAIFRVTASESRLWHPWPAPVGDLDPDNVVRHLDRDRDRLAGGTRAAVPDSYWRKSRSPARRPHPRTGARGRAPRLRTRGRARARSARPASVTLSRTASPAISTPAFPAALAPGNHAGRRADTPGCTLDSAANVKPGTPRNGHRNPVKRLPTPLPGPDSRPLCVRGHRNTTPYSATR